MHNVTIFNALLLHDLTILRRQWLSRMINSGCLIITEILLFGYFFPKMGMSETLIGPTFLGTIVFVELIFGYATALNWSMDLRNERLIDYHLTLPISKVWLFAEYVVFFMIESIILTAPVITIGLWFLRNHIQFQARPILFIAIYLLTLLFFGLFLLGSAFVYDATYFDNHIWPRRLNPLYCLSSIVVPWKIIYGFNQWIAYLFLLNPATYLIEGLRGALFDQSLYIPYWPCLFTSVGFVTLMIVRMHYGIYKQLDPV